MGYRNSISAVLHRNVYLIGALCIVTTLAGYGISFFSPLIPEKYDASAVLLVRPHDPIKIDPTNAGKEFMDFPVAQTPVVESASKTYIQIIQSPALIGEVVHELKLDHRPPRKDVATDTVFGQLYAVVKPYYYWFEPYLKGAIDIVRYGRVLKDDPFTKAVNDLKKGLVLKSYEDTYAFEIKYSDEDPQTVADVANTTANLFIQFMERMRSSEAKDEVNRLKVELEQSRRRLVDTHQSLEDYKVSHGVFLYQPEYDEKLKVISDLVRDLAKLDESLAAGTFEDKIHSTYWETAASLRKRARLVEILNQQRADLKSLPTIEREVQLRQADVDVANSTYATVAKELKDAEIKSDMVPEARVISPASVPDLPSRPRRDIIVLASLLAGLMVGVALAFFREYMNTTVRGISDIEDFIGLRVIGTIPRAPQRMLAAHRLAYVQKEVPVPGAQS